MVTCTFNFFLALL